MNILQISAPKSGSYWLHTILLQILDRGGFPRKSFIQGQPAFQELGQAQLSFKGQAGVDMMDIEEDGCYYRISSIFRERIKDLKEYAASTSLAWTHSAFCSTSRRVFPLFEKKICVVRDPRDRALSSARFAFTPYMKKHYPSSYASPEEYFKGEYERLLEQWGWHVGNYLLQKETLGIRFVFYERLLYDFENELERLLAFLEIDLSREDREAIARAVSFSAMKGKSPRHLQKGRSGKWVEQLDSVQKKVAVEKAGGLLEMLNYPLAPQPEEIGLPKVPQELRTQDLQKLLQGIQWQELFPERM